MTVDNSYQIDISGGEAVFPKPYSILVATEGRDYWVIAAAKTGVLVIPVGEEGFNFNKTPGLIWSDINSVGHAEDCDANTLKAVEGLWRASQLDTL